MLKRINCGNNSRKELLFYINSCLKAWFSKTELKSSKSFARKLEIRRKQKIGCNGHAVSNFEKLTPDLFSASKNASESCITRHLTSFNIRNRRGHNDKLWPFKFIVKYIITRGVVVWFSKTELTNSTSFARNLENKIKPKIGCNGHTVSNFQKLTPDLFSASKNTSESCITRHLTFIKIRNRLTFDTWPLTVLAD